MKVVEKIQNEGSIEGMARIEKCPKCGNPKQLTKQQINMGLKCWDCDVNEKKRRKMNLTEKIEKFLSEGRKKYATAYTKELGNELMKKRIQQHNIESKEKAAKLGLKVEVDFKFWQYVLDVLKDGKLAYILNDVLKSAQNKNGKMKVIEINDNGSYVIRIKGFEVEVPKEFIKRET